MNCNCKWTEIVIAVVTFVVVVWPNIFGAAISKWIAAIAVVLLFLHALFCKNCSFCKTEMAEEKPMKSSGKKK